MAAWSQKGRGRGRSLIAGQTSLRISPVSAFFGFKCHCIKFIARTKKCTHIKYTPADACYVLLYQRTFALRFLLMLFWHKVPLSLSLSLSLSLFLGRSPSESSSLSLICGFTPIKAITVYIYMPQLCFSILYVPMLCTFHYSLNKQLATVTFLVGDAYVAIIVSFLQS